MATIAYDKVISKLRPVVIYEGDVLVNASNSGKFITNRITDTNITTTIDIRDVIPGMYWEAEVVTDPSLPSSIQTFIVGYPGQVLLITEIVTDPTGSTFVFTIQLVMTGSPIPLGAAIPIHGTTARIVAVEPTIPGIDIEYKIVATLAL